MFLSFFFLPCVLSILRSAWIVLETIWGREGNISQVVVVVVVVLPPSGFIRPLYFEPKFDHAF